MKLAPKPSATAASNLVSASHVRLQSWREICSQNIVVLGCPGRTHGLLASPNKYQREVRSTPSATTRTRAAPRPNAPQSAVAKLKAVQNRNEKTTCRIGCFNIASIRKRLTAKKLRSSTVDIVVPAMPDRSAIRRHLFSCGYLVCRNRHQATARLIQTAATASTNTKSPDDQINLCIPTPFPRRPSGAPRYGCQRGIR